MELIYSDEHERLRGELRGYFATLMTPERRAALQGEGEYGESVTSSPPWASMIETKASVTRWEPPLATG